MWRAALRPARAPSTLPSPATCACPVFELGYFATDPAAYTRDAACSSVFTNMRPSSSKHVTMDGSDGDDVN